MSAKKILLLCAIVAGFILSAFIVFYLVRHDRATTRMHKLADELEQKIARWEKQEYKRPPLSGAAVPGNAAELYREAEAKLPLTDYKITRLLNDLVDDPSKPVPPEAESYCKADNAVLDIVKKAANAETYKPIIDLRKGFSASVPNLSSLRVIANIMTLEGRKLEKEQKMPEAVELYCEDIRMGDDYTRYGSLISAMIGITVSEKGTDELIRLLREAKLSEQELAGLLGTLEMLLKSVPAFQGIYESESLGTQAGLKNLAASAGIIPQKDAIGVFTLANRATIVNAWEEYIKLFDEISRANALPYAQAQAELNRISSSIRNPFLEVLVPNLAACTKTFNTSSTLLQGAYILAALKLYQCRHKSYPDTLGALSPEIIPEIPQDPFSGGQFVYKKLPDQGITLYSIGADLTDNGGNDSEKDTVIVPVKKTE